MQNSHTLSRSGGRAEPGRDPHIEQNRLLAAEFAHDAGARWLLRLDTAIRRVAGHFARNRPAIK